MRRRDMAIGLAALMACAPALGQDDVIQAAFNALPERERHWVQTQLHLMELYAPYDTDGRFGPMTRAAILQAADLVARRSNNSMSYDLTKPDQARAFLKDMAMERFMFIYDDGYEG